MRVGDRVILPKGHHYRVASTNPEVGSKWYCEGVIINICGEVQGVRVMWDNGGQNVYEERYLQIAKEPFTENDIEAQPNLTKMEM